jgi:NADH dehydrogenase
MARDQKHSVVIVGGGADGLALASKLGRRLGRKGRADIVLVDRSPTHLWKPLLHEVAAGTLDSHEDEIEYLAQAAYSHFRYRRGYMESLDRERREISIALMFNEKGVEVVPRRTLPYDTLVIAVGSVSNDFGVPGVEEHCLFLDNTDQAEHFQRQLFESYVLVHRQGRASARGELHIAIVGGGATGIELAAQLHEISHLLYAYGLEEVEPTGVKITLIEAASRLLPGLPAEISRATERQLRRLGIDVHTGERVVEVDAQTSSRWATVPPARGPAMKRQCPLGPRRPTNKRS